MKIKTPSNEPVDANERRAKKPVICYAPSALPPNQIDLLQSIRGSLTLDDEVIVPPREAECFEVPATSRASFAFYNTKEEIDVLVEGISKVIEVFK